MQNKLLPCPFCGSKLHKHNRYFHHEINGCLFDNYEFFEEDFKKWNTRKPMERIVERLEEDYSQDIGSLKMISVDKAIEIVKAGGTDESLN